LKKDLPNVEDEIEDFEDVYYKTFQKERNFGEVYSYPNNANS